MNDPTAAETATSRPKSLFTVARQIGALGAVGVLSVVAVAGVTWHSGRRVQDSTDRVVRAAELGRYQMEADMLHDALRADVFASLITTSPAERERVRGQVAEHTERMRAAIEASDALVEPGPVQEAIDAVRPKLDAYVAHAQRLTEINSSVARRELEEFSARFDELEAAMGDVSDLIAQETAAAADAADSARRTSDLMTVVILVGALVAVAVAATLIVRRIRAGVAAVLDGLRSLAGRDLTAEMPVRGGDEFAIMAEAFNDATAQLRDALAEVTQSA
ncbi:MAG TPA: HAMP domain-containing protein, partial [Acidimicrobiales bacterium]